MDLVNEGSRVSRLEIALAIVCKIGLWQPTTSALAHQPALTETTRTLTETTMPTNEELLRSSMAQNMLSAGVPMEEG